MPRISVIIPTYNNQETIEECLRSVRQSVFHDYELIVADSGSRDATPSIAASYADQVITLPGTPHRGRTRNCGLKAAQGEIVVNIDSDVLIKPDTLDKIVRYFSRHPQIDALTGLLDKEHPNLDFFSQYKNLYMHYVFKKLPERINFLYGSIYAIRRQVAEIYDSEIKIADDTALGQKLATCGKRIALVNDLEVVHLKKYNLFSFIKNDFKIPYDWAKIFLKYKGWKQLGRNKTGYAHASRQQLLSIIIAPAILMGVFLGDHSLPFIIVFSLIWSALNFHFSLFLIKEKGSIFGIFSIPVTFIDNIVMAFGIFCGLFIFSSYQNTKGSRRKGRIDEKAA